MRNALGIELARAFGNNPNHKLFCGDIGYRIFDELREKYPEQFMNYGISEQHMITSAAAFAEATGVTSICYTINPFITSRVHDQLRVDVAYACAPLIICSVGAGFAYDTLGFTHFGIEDLALINSLPNFDVYTPGDPSDVEAIVRQLFLKKRIDAPAYLRLQKGGEINLSSIDSKFISNDVEREWEGTDIHVITHGAISSIALAAREQLKGIVSVKVTVVLNWTSYLKSLEDKLNLNVPMIIYEECASVGSLASLISMKLLENKVRANNIKIMNVKQAAFDVMLSRRTLLELNELDESSLIKNIHGMLQ